ncbi:MAG: hypothetical protein Q4B68_03950 [Bacteroidales bacterium]|nr:hypothetical protein [Bacteroidales bacterium]
MEFYESFMKFSFADDDIFRIEDDELAKATKGIKACECVVLISENVALVEAKSSAPRIDNEEKFNHFISDIRQKFAHSLRLFNDIKNKEHGEAAFLRLPINLQLAQLPTDTYKIYLIVHGHKWDWLLGLIDALRVALKEEVKKWNLRDSNIKVFNEESALENHLIVAFVPREEVQSLRQPDGNMDQELAKQWFSDHE